MSPLPENAVHLDQCLLRVGQMFKAFAGKDNVKTIIRKRQLLRIRNAEFHQSLAVREFHVGDLDCSRGKIDCRHCPCFGGEMNGKISRSATDFQN